MDQLTGLQLFREVVEAGSFIAAAERLNVSSPMASKHVAQLERRLGVRLLHRSSRHMSLTEAGELYYAQVKQALDTLEAAESALGQHTLTPRGPLKVSAPVWCANPAFAGVLVAYRDRYPEVVVDLRLENRRVDLVAEGFDLALRATFEPTPNLIARPICPVQFQLVAAPHYLKSLGTKPTIDDFCRLNAIVPSYVKLDKLSLQGPCGRVPVRMKAVMRSDDTTLTYHAVLRGLGVAFLPNQLIADDVRAKRLVPVFPDYSVPEFTLYAVYASRRYMTSKLRSFIDFFVQRLGSGKA